MYCPDCMLDPPARTREQEAANRLCKRYDELKHQIPVLRFEMEHIAQELRDLGYSVEPLPRCPMTKKQAVRWASDFAYSIGREDVSCILDSLSDRMEYGPQDGR